MAGESLTPTQGLPQLLPWQHDAADRLLGALGAGRLPHALLFAGAPGIGKRHLADWLAATVLCEARTAEGPCGTCRGCRLFAGDSHPDLHRIGLEDDALQLRIDAIRALIAFTRLSSQYAGYRVAIIRQADRMNRNAANSLLKTLEEPPGATVLLLVADRPALLPATIRSRCQHVRLSSPDAETAADWLRQQGSSEAVPLLPVTGNAPLRALAMHGEGGDALLQRLLETLAGVAAGRLSPLAGAEGWQQDQLPLMLDLLTAMVQRLVRSHGTAVTDATLGPLQSLTARLDQQRLHAYLDYLYETQRLRDRALQPRLLVEDLLIRWRQASAVQAGGDGVRTAQREARFQHG